MAYEGINLYECATTLYPWGHTYVVVVSGSSWNPCGHTILNVGGVNGHYLHIAGDGYARPYYMDAKGYQRYLSENKKKELSRQYVKVPKPLKAQQRLDELAAKPWLWMVLPNNCASFVEKILQAGGAEGGLYSNCPAMEGWN